MLDIIFEPLQFEHESGHLHPITMRLTVKFGLSQQCLDFVKAYGLNKWEGWWQPEHMPAIDG